MSIGKDTLATSNTEKSATSEKKEMPGPWLNGREGRAQGWGCKTCRPPFTGGGEGGGGFQSSHFYMPPWKLSREHHLMAGQGDTLWSTFQMPLKGRRGEKWHFYDSKVTNGYWEGSGHTSAPCLAFAASVRVLDGWLPWPASPAPSPRDNYKQRVCTDVCVCVYIYSSCNHIIVNKVIP